MMMCRFYLFIFLFLSFNIIIAQIAVTNAPPFNTAENIVNDLLLGDDLETTNWSWQNGATNIGYFDGFASNVGFENFAKVFFDQDFWLSIVRAIYFSFL